MSNKNSIIETMNILKITLQKRTILGFTILMIVLQFIGAIHLELWFEFLAGDGGKIGLAGLAVVLVYALVAEFELAGKAEKTQVVGIVEQLNHVKIELEVCKTARLELTSQFAELLRRDGVREKEIDELKKMNASLAETNSRQSVEIDLLQRLNERLQIQK